VTYTKLFGSGTVNRYEWTSQVIPDPALTNEIITLQAQGLPNLSPTVSIYDWDRQIIEENMAMVEQGPGLYIYDIVADSSFATGKGYSYTIIEQDTDVRLSGSGMIGKYSWTSTLFPNPAFLNETVTIQCQGLTNLSPKLTVYDSNRNVVVSNIVMSQDSPGMYRYDMKTDERFDTGKGYTYTIIEEETSTQLSGSGMLGKYVWTSTLFPNPALTNDTITIQCQGLPDLEPLVVVYDSERKVIEENMSMEEVSPGIYLYTIKANSKFETGKGYTYNITEDKTNTKLFGSGMVGQYPWKTVVFPNPALGDDNLTIQCQGLPRLIPTVDIYNWDGEPIIAAFPMEEVSSGLYVYEIMADQRFTYGKGYTYTINELETKTLLNGSGMVEAMSITTVAGLAASAPMAERTAQKALDAIKAVEAVLISGDSMNIALTLKNLKKSVEELPEALSKEGPSAILTRTVNDISARLKTLAGDQGFDLGILVETAIEESTTLEDMRVKTQKVGEAVGIMTEIF
ncbi:MAG: hypothetical protein KAJ14_00465, partial [Candidatus Omnitrophica bacterium]|nr:hypothetical protein [Candidatus Omnitrophota bacterium]